MFLKTTATKIFTFEAGHQLTDCYSKECLQPHGHSYTCEVTFEGSVDPKTGMVIDFKLIKEIVQPIINQYDHQFLTNESYGKNPTAENMANDIFWKIKDKTIMVVQVKLWETATSYITVGYQK